MHDSSFWEHDVFSIVLRDNKLEDDGEQDEAEKSLLLHMLELMKHCQFSNIRLVAYKHSLFVYNLIYKGIVQYPEICDTVRSLEINSYILPQLEGLLPVVSKCEKLKELSLVFFEITKSPLYSNTVLGTTLLEKIVVSCGNSKHEFVETLIRASPHLKHFGFTLSFLNGSTIQSLQNCTQLQVLHISCDTLGVLVQDILLEFIQNTKLKEFSFHAHNIKNKLHYRLLEKITQCWCDSLEKLSLRSDDLMFATGEDIRPLTPCPLLHYFEFRVGRAYQSGTPDQYFWLVEFLKTACTTALRTLRLSRVYFTDNRVTQRFTSLRNIKLLEICATLKDDDPLLSLLEIAGESLETLESRIVNTWHTSEATDLGRVVGLCPNLREVGPVYAKDLQTLSSFPNLHTLHFSFEREVDYSSCSELKNLRHLEITLLCRPSIDANPVYALLENSPNLYSLEIHGVGQYYSNWAFPLDIVKIASRCPNLKVLGLHEKSFQVPSHTNFKSLIKVSNGGLNSWTGQKLEPAIAWMICCTDLSNFDLDPFIDKIKLQDYLGARLMDMSEEGTDAEIVWKLFVTALEDLSSNLVGKYILGDGGPELVERFLKYAHVQEDKYKARERHVMPVGERGWDLSLPQFYDIIHELYPQLTHGGISLFD